MRTPGGRCQPYREDGLRRAPCYFSSSNCYFGSSNSNNGGREARAYGRWAETGVHSEGGGHRADPDILNLGARDHGCHVQGGKFCLNRLGPPLAEGTRGRIDSGGALSIREFAQYLCSAMERPDSSALLPGHALMSAIEPADMEHISNSIAEYTFGLSEAEIVKIAIGRNAFRNAVLQRRSGSSFVSEPIVAKHIGPTHPLHQLNFVDCGLLGVAWHIMEPLVNADFRRKAEKRGIGFERATTARFVVGSNPALCNRFRRRNVPSRRHCWRRAGYTRESYSQLR